MIEKNIVAQWKQLRSPKAYLRLFSYFQLAGNISRLRTYHLINNIIWLRNMNINFNTLGYQYQSFLLWDEMITYQFQHMRLQTYLLI